MIILLKMLRKQKMKRQMLQDPIEQVFSGMGRFMVSSSFAMSLLTSISMKTKINGAESMKQHPNIDK
jgi:hypothetical protein